MVGRGIRCDFFWYGYYGSDLGTPGRPIWPKTYVGQSGNRDGRRNVIDWACPGRYRSGRTTPHRRLIGGYASASIVMIGSQVPRERAGWALGVLSTGALSGNLIGPLVGGFLPEFVGIRGTFFVGGGMIAVAAITTILFVREDFDRASDAKQRDKKARPEGAGSKWPIIGALLITAMMVLLANMSIEPIITVYIGDLGVPVDNQARIAGVVMACSALGSILTAAKLGALADRVGSWNVIVGCLLLTGVVMVPQAFVTQWWQLAVLRGVMGMTIAGLLPSIAKLIRHSVEEHNFGKILGYLQSAQFSGQVIGPLIGGQIGAHLGLHHVFLVTAALLVLCAGMNGWMRYRYLGASAVTPSRRTLSRKVDNALEK
jgi:MFS family permease